MAELLIYSALVFGVGAVTASHSMVKFSEAWVSAAFAVYLVDLGVLHGWIRRYQRNYVAVVKRLEALEPGASATGEADVGPLRSPRAAGRPRLGRCSTSSWSAAVYLMVFKPGG